ncbi:hypothetical protein J2S74_003091 [Evansella vedderi]|uniref:Uncharacterized protein n=1 Tax=Evansella vedderi TaxID=38282 RepID=A0ABT9ZWV0_9BACI|nr:hypothetical protein [Evansella vedderi]
MGETPVSTSKYTSGALFKAEKINDNVLLK